MAAAPVPHDDVDRIMAVMKRAFDPAFGEAWNRRQLSDALLVGQCHCGLLAAHGGAPDAFDDAAGFYLSRSVLDEEELLLLAVDPAHRRRGLGAALVDAFLDAARQRGVRRLLLEMRRGNSAAGLYESRGFRVIGVRPAYYRGSDGRRIDALSFERVIEPTVSSVPALD